MRVLCRRQAGTVHCGFCGIRGCYGGLPNQLAARGTNQTQVVSLEFSFLKNKNGGSHSPTSHSGGSSKNVPRPWVSEPLRKVTQSRFLFLSTVPIATGVKRNGIVNRGLSASPHQYDILDYSGNPIFYTVWRDTPRLVV